MSRLTDLMIAAIGGTGFIEFVDGPINGLWRQQANCLDVLAVVSDVPGKGLFAAWLAKMMTTHRRIRFLHTDNPLLVEVLRRRGFLVVEWFENGELVRGMKWQLHAKLSPAAVEPAQ